LIWFRLNGLSSSQNSQNSLILNWCIGGCCWFTQAMKRHLVLPTLWRVLVPFASVKFLCDCTKCVICNGVKEMLKVLSQKYFKATTVHLSLCFLINTQNMVVAFWRNFKFESSLLLGFRIEVICCVRLGVYLFWCLFFQGVPCSSIPHGPMVAVCSLWTWVFFFFVFMDKHPQEILAKFDYRSES
jgi:hypothetical protein